MSKENRRSARSLRFFPSEKHIRLTSFFICPEFLQFWCYLRRQDSKGAPCPEAPPCHQSCQGSETRGPVRHRGRQDHRQHRPRHASAPIHVRRHWCSGDHDLAIREA